MARDILQVRPCRVCTWLQLMYCFLNKVPQYGSRAHERPSQLGTVELPGRYLREAST